MKWLAHIILVSIVIFSNNCSKEKWHGKIYKEQGVKVIESEGQGIWGDKINERITFKENLSEVKFYLDFFNEKGQFLGSYKLPEEATLNTIDHEDNFYFVQQLPFPRIIRSSINIK